MERNIACRCRTQNIVELLPRALLFTRRLCKGVRNHFLLIATWRWWQQLLSSQNKVLNVLVNYWLKTMSPTNYIKSTASSNTANKNKMLRYGINNVFLCELNLNFTFISPSIHSFAHSWKKRRCRGQLSRWRREMECERLRQITNIDNNAIVIMNKY